MGHIVFIDVGRARRPAFQVCAIGYFEKISSTRLNACLFCRGLRRRLVLNDLGSGRLPYMLVLDLGIGRV
jgi:hypothetical protein